MKQKAFFIIFKGLSVAKNYLRPESAPLKIKCSQKDRLQILLLILSEFRRTNFHFRLNRLKTYDFPLIYGGMEVY